MKLFTRTASHSGKLKHEERKRFELSRKHELHHDQQHIIQHIWVIWFKRDFWFKVFLVF